jgi:steroid delta-isomerase-like uncharacterized protein
MTTVARDLHDKMFEAIERRDLDELRALYHAEYSYTGSDGEEQKGAELGVAVSKMFLDALPDARLDVRTRYACGDNVSIIEFVGRGTHRGELMGVPATGRSLAVWACDIIEVRDGRIYREREYMDTLSILQQLGVKSTD